MFNPLLIKCTFVCCLKPRLCVGVSPTFLVSFLMSPHISHITCQTTCHLCLIFGVCHGSSGDSSQPGKICGTGRAVKSNDWLVVDLPLWKMMDIDSWGYSSQLIWKVIKFHGSNPPTSHFWFQLKVGLLDVKLPGISATCEKPRKDGNASKGTPWDSCQWFSHSGYVR